MLNSLAGFARFIEAQSVADTLCGSPLYMAPEILKFQKYNAQADLWSVGAIFFEMLTGRPPYKCKNHYELLQLIETATITIPTDVSISAACRELLFELLQKGECSQDRDETKTLTPDNHRSKTTYYLVLLF